MGNRFNSQGATDGHKTNNISAGNLNFGSGGRGETLNGKRERFGYYPGKDEEKKITYFVNRRGMYDEGILEIKNNEGLTSLKSSDGNWYEYPIFLEYQIEYSLERGDGKITWPDKEGRPYGSDIDLDILLHMDEEKIDRDLLNVGMDDRDVGYILDLLRKFKNNEEKTRDYLRKRHEDLDLEILCSSHINKSFINS